MQYLSAPLGPSLYSYITSSMLIKSVMLIAD